MNEIILTFFGLENPRYFPWMKINQHFPLAILLSKNNQDIIV